jgi:hypothetical protein
MIIINHKDVNPKRKLNLYYNYQNKINLKNNRIPKKYNKIMNKIDKKLLYLSIINDIAPFNNVFHFIYDLFFIRV